MRYVLFGADLGRDDGTGAFHDVEFDPQGGQRGQYVRKHDDAIHAVGAMTLQTQFNGHGGGFAALAKGVFVGVLAEG